MRYTLTWRACNSRGCVRTWAHFRLHNERRQPLGVKYTIGSVNETQGAGSAGIWTTWMLVAASIAVDHLDGCAEFADGERCCRKCCGAGTAPVQRVFREWLSINWLENPFISNIRDENMIEGKRQRAGEVSAEEIESRIDESVAPSLWQRHKNDVVQHFLVVPAIFPPPFPKFWD